MTRPLRAWLDSLPEGERIGRLHKATGIPLRSLHRYANGDQWPAIERAAEIARATGLPLAAVANPKDIATLEALAPLASPGADAHKSPRTDDAESLGQRPQAQTYNGSEAFPKQGAA